MLRWVEWFCESYFVLKSLLQVVGGRSRTTSFDSFASASTIARRNTPVYVGSNGPLRTASVSWKLYVFVQC